MSYENRPGGAESPARQNPRCTCLFDLERLLADVCADLVRTRASRGPGCEVEVVLLHECVEGLSLAIKAAGRLAGVALERGDETLDLAKNAVGMEQLQQANTVLLGSLAESDQRMARLLEGKEPR